MRLDFAFLADAATIMDDGRFDVIGGGFDVLQAPGFPAIKYAVALVVRVVFEPSEFGKTYQLHGEIVGPDGIKLPPDMWLSVKPFTHPRDPTRENWTTVCFNYQGLSFPVPGDYFIRLSIGDLLLGQVKIEVIPPGGQK